MKRDTCETCKWFDPMYNFCRRDTPSVHGWPHATLSDWCSRWQANEELVKAKLRAIEDANEMLGE